MPDPKRESLPEGLYEAPLTQALVVELEALRALGRASRTEELDPADSHELLAQHLYQAVRGRLRMLPKEDRVRLQTELLNDLLRLLGEPDLQVEPPGRALYSVSGPSALALPESVKPGAAAGPVRPDIPLGQSDLLVNARGEPGVGHALQQEIPSADRIDLLCAFIRWQGLVTLRQRLRSHLERGRPLRVITTTYCGATERRALDELEAMGAEVMSAKVPA